MSTVIGNAFRVRTGNLLVLYERLNALRGPIQDLQRRADATFLADHAVTAIDRAAADGTGIERPLSAAWDELDQRRKEVKSSGYRDLSVDVDFSVCLMPYGKSIYGIVFTEHRDWADLLLGQPWAEPFDYWNNTDRDPSLTARQWAQRRRVWDAILKKDSRPSQCGVTFEILPKHYRVPVEEILALVPPLEQRAHALAVDRLCHERCMADPELDQQDVSSFLSAHRRARRWLREPEGQEALRASTERLSLLLPTIVETILVDGLPPPKVVA